MGGTDRVIVKKSSNNSSAAASPEASDNGTNHLQPETVINLDHGDPTMYESYWKEVGEKCSFTIPAFQSLSYFSNKKNICWFMEPKLEEEIKKLHHNIGNAVVENRYIVVGTGSSQLILAALYALSAHLGQLRPVSIVSAAPYYSSYPEMVEFLQSGHFKWSGDAREFNEDKAYIEMVTSPNNPDGVIREPVVKQLKGNLVYDLAYYWPQYTAITSAADQDVMLFTVSKCTGHAGSRIGASVNEVIGINTSNNPMYPELQWKQRLCIITRLRLRTSDPSDPNVIRNILERWAVVKDAKVARDMVKFIEINTIGVSKEAQLRAAKILEIISLSCQEVKPLDLENFFQHSHCLMAKRWKKLRDIVKNNSFFHIAKFPIQYCKFSKESTETYSAFAWMKCKEGLDTEKLLRENNILARSGRRFGSGAEYVRISMLCSDEEFDLFVQRLSAIQGIANGN